jgi:hypothetical protein
MVLLITTPAHDTHHGTIATSITVSTKPKHPKRKINVDYELDENKKDASE